MNKKQIIIKSLKKLEETENKLKLTRARRKWIEQDKRINLLNYFFYRYLTNDFELYLINNTNPSETISSSAINMARQIE